MVEKLGKALYRNLSKDDLEVTNKDKKDVQQHASLRTDR
jgi:hypothetical protein